MKISTLEIENVKRVHLARFAPNQNGLTIVGGKNAQGKTSVLDAIVYALGGEKYRPSNLQNEDGVADARIYLELNNGLVVERRGKNCSLKVTDSDGKKAGQKLLDTFVDELALNLGKFINLNDKDKANEILHTLGIEKELEEIAIREKVAYDNRQLANSMLKQKELYVDNLIAYEDVPEDLVSAAELIKQSQAILAQNEINSQARTKLSNLTARKAQIKEQMAELQENLEKIDIELSQATANPIPEDVQTAELEQQISDIDNLNSKIRANKEREHALDEVMEYDIKADEANNVLKTIRKEREDLLNDCELPLDGLTIERNEKEQFILLYNGKAWDCMSNMEQIRVATAIVKAKNPNCKFILIDKLESFDSEQIAIFNDWLISEDLQAICTKVGKEDCSIIIEEGYAVDDNVVITPPINRMNEPIAEELEEF